MAAEEMTPPQPVAPASGTVLDPSAGVTLVARETSAELIEIQVWVNEAEALFLTTHAYEGMRASTLPASFFQPGGSLYVGQTGTVYWRPETYCYHATGTVQCFGETRSFTYQLPERPSIAPDESSPACVSAKETVQNHRERVAQLRHRIARAGNAVLLRELRRRLSTESSLLKRSVAAADTACA